MNKKSIILLLAIILCILVVCIFLVLNNNDRTKTISKDNNEIKKENVYSIAYSEEKFKNLPINYIQPCYAYDISTPEKAIGLADYTFIGKVNKILRTEYRHPTQTVINGEIKTVSSPYTIYEVSVIKNIDGNLITNETIEIAQAGGLEQELSTYSFYEGMGLLNIGEYYILLAFTQPDGSLLFDNPEFVVSLENLDTKLLQTINTKSTVEILSDYKINTTKKPNSTPNDIINKYIKASQEQVNIANKEKSKSKLYDVEFRE